MFFVYAPRDNMACNQALTDSQSGDATRFIVAAHNGFTEEGLIIPLLSHSKCFRWPRR